jgi:A/G-specific adenine glycosylase
MKPNYVRPTAAQVSRVRRLLLAWGRERGRAFPWRRWRDPWRLLLSEILLRRTNASKVRMLIPSVLRALSSPRAACAIRESELRGILRPFGMQAVKARQIKSMALDIVSRWGGRVPRDRKALQSLPGVGPYIAGAVLAALGGRAGAAVDANVARVVVRVFGLVPIRARARDDLQVRGVAEALVGRAQGPGVLWAILDVAASLCRPAHPRCPECPLRDLCHHARGLVSAPPPPRVRRELNSIHAATVSASISTRQERGYASGNVMRGATRRSR